MVVKYQDKGLKRLVLGLQFLDNLHLSFGVTGKDGRLKYEGGMNVATVALYNEFGTIDVPARDFLRGTLVEKRQEIIKKVQTEIRAVVVKNKDPVKALASIGRFVTAHVRLRITASRAWAKPNAPSTMKQKGFNWPLHETMLLSKSISWQIRQPGPKGPVVKRGR